VNRSKKPVLLVFGLCALKAVCYLILFSLNRNLFLLSRNILRSFLLFSLPSVSLCISLFIISGQKPLKFSLCSNIFDMLKFPFVSHIPAAALGSFVCSLPDSGHHCIYHDQKWQEEKNMKKKEGKYLEEVWFGR